MLWTAGVLIVLGLLFPLAPRAVDGLNDAAARFTDRAAYAAAVYERPAPGPVAEAEPHHERVLDVSLALLSVLGAAALALAILRGPGVRLLGPGQGAVERGFFRLRRLHSGQVGDYIAWMTVGVAAFGGALALALG
jgi:multicomponent Na+:H+ antiporter subunit D